MNENDELNLEDDEQDAVGSDELLSDDDLRLPETANILVRLHAVRAWLARRRGEAMQAVGEAALALQAATQQPQDDARPRRRARQNEENPVGKAAIAQARLQKAQASLAAFEQAQELLDECIAHTQGERVLVEYYLMIEQRLLDAGSQPLVEPSMARAPEYEALAEVLQRVEHVGIPEEE